DLLGLAGRPDGAAHSRHGADRWALDRAGSLRAPSDRVRHDRALGPGPAMTPARRYFNRRRVRRMALGAIPFVALALLWQMNAVYRWLAPIHVPPPSAVWNAIINLQDGCPGVV